MCTSFSISPSIRRETGIPVQFATTSATSLGVDHILEELRTRSPFSRHLSQLGRRLKLLLQLRDRPVLKLGRTAEISLSLGALELRPGLLQALLELRDSADCLLLALPLRVHRRRALALLRQRTLELLATGDGPGVVVLSERLELDLELHDVTVDLVDLSRLGVDLHADPRPRLVDQIDRLVRQEAIGDVAVTEGRRRDECGVLDTHLVVNLVALLEPAQDRDRILRARLAHEHRLEAALERRVLLDVLAVLVKGGRPDTAKLATSQHRLEMLPASTEPSAAPAPTIVCSSSMNTTICPSASAISFSTAFIRSSISPRYFDPATIAPMSSETSLRSRSPSGTSPSTILCASPSTIAVFPTPGSPISTGLFFVRLLRT
jgi:hypothetical protein